LHFFFFLDEEDVIVLAKKGSNLKVKCHYSEDYEPDEYEWKKIKDNRHFAVLPTEILSTSQWYLYNYFDTYPIIKRVGICKL